ncbi:MULTISPECIES: hypothetical protein [unclassified Spirosoma]|uniref:hypothetical protein n=1 Tax=unclassified Spirosoma TaxID=2621999 RepID=UPI00095CDAF1|nr:MULTISPECIES: hypothetical protein [unclassified Spirosoma]MBN8826034.1 hypothetical protein [Spirosoma sp.]OJW75487.1 MAG: hypothetical protein BGO59_08065 [Spirosoma sp. 48-14]
MKRFLIIGTIVFSACQSNDTLPANQVSVRLHQSARLSSDIIVRVDSIWDGRCPNSTSFSCLTAGSVTVKLLLSKSVDSSAVRLTLGYYDKNNRLDSTKVTLSSQAYKVVLKDVTPYPTSFMPDPTQKAIVEVARL